MVIFAWKFDDYLRVFKTVVFSSFWPFVDIFAKYFVIHNKIENLTDTFL